MAKISLISTQEDRRSPSLTLTDDVPFIHPVGAVIKRDARQPTNGWGAIVAMVEVVVVMVEVEVIMHSTSLVQRGLSDGRLRKAVPRDFRGGGERREGGG